MLVFGGVAGPLSSFHIISPEHNFFVKGEASTNHQFVGSMLVFGGV